MRGVSWSAILLKDKTIGHQYSSIFGKLWSYIVYIAVSIHSRFLVHKTKLTSNRDPIGCHYVTCKLLLKDQSTGINVCFVTRSPNVIVLLASMREQGWWIL